MKRYGNLWQKIISMDNLKLAYKKARKGKTWQKSIKVFDKDIEGNLLKIQASLINKTFRTSAYNTKTIYEPKKRKIYILPFAPDRIVQHALMNALEPIWTSFFIFDSYACLLNKGIHRGSLRTMEFIRKNKYCLKCDIAKFYPSIDHDVLFAMIKRKIKCKDTLQLIQEIIYSSPGGKNAPIGNYTSQWFGNLYMNELDQFAKHVLKVKCYIRYCDDFLFFGNDKKELHRIALAVEDFLANTLKLTMSKCNLFPVKQGVDFLGYRHFRGYILLRKSTAKRVKRRLKVLPLLFKKGRISLEHLRASLASTLGWLMWANTYNLALKLQIDNLTQLCQTNDLVNSQKSPSL